MYVKCLTRFVRPHDYLTFHSFPLSHVSESAGQLLVVDDGGFIYLDVGWLTYVLKPILDHTLEDRPVPYHLGKMRDELNRNGLLRLEFARYLWSRVMKTEISDGLFDALCRV
ncbi:unnamed protein product, partial [Scytosiphon promiscuus]